MLFWLTIIFALLLAIFQIWWAVAYGYAYRQVHAPALLARSASGVAYVIFFGAAFVSLAGGRTMDQWSVGALLLLVAASVIGWRLLGGPALELRHYPRGWRDVLAFRRPTVDLRRRVRSR